MEGVGLTTVDAARITTGLTDQFVSDVDVQHCIGALKKTSETGSIVKCSFLSDKNSFPSSISCLFCEAGVGTSFG